MVPETSPAGPVVLPGFRELFAEYVVHSRHADAASQVVLLLPPSVNPADWYMLHQTLVSTLPEIEHATAGQTSSSDEVSDFTDSPSAFLPSTSHRNLSPDVQRSTSSQECAKEPTEPNSDALKVFDARPKKYVCHVCSRAFHRPSSLATHMNSHTGDRLQLLYSQPTNMPAPVQAPRTLYDKIWNDHVIDAQEDGLSLIYIDRHLIHEVTTPQAFEGLKNAGRPVRRPDCTLGTVDHNVPTSSRKNFKDIESFIDEPESRAMCLLMDQNVKEFGVTYFGMTDRRQGIVHVIGPEEGFTLPGITCVCGDSHTSTHGAFGALAFGIGTSEVEHVLATQTLLQRKAKNMRITVDGHLNEGVTSKDVILHIIGVIGTAGGTGCVIEYAGSVIRGLSMEARMSMCNMSIEGGARAGMIAPDQITFDYLKGRPLAPKGEEWDRAEAYWRALKTDEGAKFDIEVSIRGEDITPTVTWGTSPQDVAPITGNVPDPAAISDPVKRSSVERQD
ncbi:hypothetical protein NM688_g6039 [Phlebia brevispora]|uniref:Uncharacterized protein n=1 Tax=Phlebia brevispora TaxID=194682 RepID=A0ACC1SKP5_9APHY|nr:hypothetical protein NM688_g6039 [Phlebia brevispora]